MNATPSRQPAGVPTGGQFAASARTEVTGVDLSRPISEHLDSDFDRSWRDTLGETLGHLADGEQHVVVGAHWRTAVITCERTSTSDAQGRRIAGAFRGTYTVAADGYEPVVCAYDNADGNESAAIDGATATVMRMLDDGLVNP